MNRSAIRLAVCGVAMVLAVAAADASPSIVYPQNGSSKEILAAKEVRRYIYLRTNKSLKMTAAGRIPIAGDIILVAESGSALVKGLSLGYSPKAGEIVLKTVKKGGRNILVVTGNDPDSTLVAAYRFAERLGVGFDLAGDAVPDARITLSIAGYDEVGTPLFDTRGIQPFHDFFQGPDIWSTDDYNAIISQLPKMGLNFIGLKTYPKYSMEWEVDSGIPIGPEPTVWSG
jgi:hypothetical protein